MDRLTRRLPSSSTLQRRNINDLSAVNAITLDPTTFAETPLIEAVPFPRHRTNLTPRIDYPLSKNNTLTVRYQYYRDTEENDGIGQFTLPSQGYNADSTEHTLQISDTQVIGSKIVNEIRFQYLRELDNQFAVNSQPTLNVLGSFDGGGNNQGVILDHQDHYELQNYTSILHGNHTVKFGARLRGIRDANSQTSGFNGEFTFSSLLPTPQEQACVPAPGASTLPHLVCNRASKCGKRYHTDRNPAQLHAGQAASGRQEISMLVSTIRTIGKCALILL